MSYLGIDLGTSGLRALLVDEGGLPIGSAESAYGVSNPAPGWSEQNPADWLLALDRAVGELNERFSAFNDLRGIGVAGHMHGATLLDETGEVLRPCILWNDTRSESEAALLDKLDGVRALSGNIVFPGFTSPKLAWVKKHEPDVFARVRKVLLPAAYLNFHLTGEYVADMSDSAGTSWLDVGKRTWSQELLDAGEMTLDQMPDLVEGSEKAGTLNIEQGCHAGSQPFHCHRAPSEMVQTQDGRNRLRCDLGSRSRECIGALSTSAVLAYQIKLTRHCPALPKNFADGIEGPATRAALRTFQAAYGLTPDVVSMEGIRQPP